MEPLSPERQRSTPPPPPPNPPAARLPTTPCSKAPCDTLEASPLARSEELVDFCCSDSKGEEDSPDRALKTAVHRVSYKEALTGVRTFKPRLNANTAGAGEGGWSAAERRKVSDRRATVWARLGGRAGSIQDRLGGKASIHDRLGSRVPPASNLLQLLRAKAGDRCYNCFARDHRIAQCRDPPRCVLCSKSGHKARYYKGRSERTQRAVQEEGCGKEKVSRVAMEFVPGEPEQRPAKVTACAGRTAAIREAEREATLHALIGVQLGARVRLSCDEVRREALQQLRLPEHLLFVTMLKEATFLLRFEQPAHRTAALGRGMLAAGRTHLHLMPWSRQYSASAASKLPYRVRVCVEGVPEHAAQVEVLSKLFPPTAIIDEIDTVKNSKAETACVCSWVSVDDPDGIAVEGILKIEEPMELSEEQHFECSGNMESRPRPAALLDYEVILHVDQVVDFTSSGSSPSWQSYESETSGIPDESVEDEWPAKHRFFWRLGESDRKRSPQRPSVHERLGERRRDRSPPGGGAGGHGRMQYPPPPHFALARAVLMARRLQLVVEGTLMVILGITGAVGLQLALLQLPHLVPDVPELRKMAVRLPG
ncbi:hypothetical protein C2845_PM15G25150 [Panicum miliaceum]|uniref:Uncharacterized protein n=1 Tax=Panicum miliaceum TaxID=4540 RepID=A0A3L6QA64_PANMI|nr:hypothetical protein C2845_PM15G25150 [Panicum miliaceum]